MLCQLALVRMHPVEQIPFRWRLEDAQRGPG
jgi:hypothetical protein